VGFGSDLTRYFHEQPPVPKIVHVHAIATTLWLLIAPVSQLSWHAVNLKTPDALPPEFLSIAFGGVLCMAVLLPWGILIRCNSAAHRRVLILAIVCIGDAGFSRMMGLFQPQPPKTFLGTYLAFEGGNLLIVLLMFFHDWKRNRIMKQFLHGAFLVIAVDLAATGLYFNETWKAISRSWLEHWAF
jgi:hypothetical protein